MLCAGAPDTPEIAAETERRRRRSCPTTRTGVVWIRDMLPRAEITQLLTHATVFVCPSVYEPLGIVNLEAMACETAVVASAVGGIPEVVADGLTGLLVPYLAVSTEEFEAGLAEAVNALCADPARAAAMGRAGRERAVHEFGWDAIAHRTVELYESLLYARPDARRRERLSRTASAHRRRGPSNAEASARASRYSAIRRRGQSRLPESRDARRHQATVNRAVAVPGSTSVKPPSWTTGAPPSSARRHCRSASRRGRRAAKPAPASARAASAAQRAPAELRGVRGLGHRLAGAHLDVRRDAGRAGRPGARVRRRLGVVELGAAHLQPGQLRRPGVDRDRRVDPHLGAARA